MHIDQMCFFIISYYHKLTITLSIYERVTLMFFTAKVVHLSGYTLINLDHSKMV